MRRLIPFVLASSLFTVLSWAAPHPQTQTAPPPITSMNPFEQLKQEAIRSALVKAKMDRDAEQTRSDAVAGLRQQLPRLIEQAQALETQLEHTDLQAKLPAALAKRAIEIEEMARRIHKTVKQL